MLNLIFSVIFNVLAIYADPKDEFTISHLNT